MKEHSTAGMMGRIESENRIRRSSRRHASRRRGLASKHSSGAASSSSPVKMERGGHRFSTAPRQPRRKCTLVAKGDQYWETASRDVLEEDDLFDDRIIGATGQSVLTLRLVPHLLYLTERRPQQARPWPRRIRPLLQLRPRCPQGQGHQAIHCPQHRRGRRRP